MTILSVNKTRLLCGCGLRPFFVVVIKMKYNVKHMTLGAVLAALYVALCHLQNLLVPGSASWTIQFRVAEALCVLALFTPAAISGLSIGCFLFNLSFSAALPLDSIVGTLATFLATSGMYLLRKVCIKGYPLPAMLLPALFNAILVGWELDLYIGGGFLINAFYVAVGELVVLLLLGTALFYGIKSRGMDKEVIR